MKEGVSYNELLNSQSQTHRRNPISHNALIYQFTRIFLKRKPNELCINNFNSACLRVGRASMDVQFVLDVYACAVYIVNY